jgi:hypothetical protein
MAKTNEPVAAMWAPAKGPLKGKSGLVVSKKWAVAAENQNGESSEVLDYLGHVLTWHDVKIKEQGNFRIWVHSLSRSKTRRDFFSLEVQRHGTVFSPVEQTEADARISLAEIVLNWPSEGSMKSSLLRQLPSGQVLEDHARQIDQYLMSFLETSGNVIDFKEASGRAKGVKPSKYEKAFRSTGKDSIILAKLYALRSESAGSSRVGKRICEDLGIESSVLYTAIRIARAKGWLTEGRKGIAGGTMTALGEEYFLENDGPARLEKITGIKIGN